MTSPNLGLNPARRSTDRVTPPRRVLVLGAGFIGAYVVRELIESGHQVDVVTRSTPRPELVPLLKGASIVIGDVASMSTLAVALAPADHVIYAVGSSSPIESDLDPASDISAVVPPVVRLLELLRLKPGVGVTFLSSGGAVYGNTMNGFADESTNPEPISSYGILKFTAEKYLAMYANVHGVPVRILRLANAYGPGQPWAKGQGIVPRLMRCAVNGDSMPIFGTGSNVRDYVYISDIAAAVVALLHSGSGEPVINVGSGVGYSILELVEMVASLTGRQIALEFRDARSFDVESIVLDTKILTAAIDFKPTDIAHGLAQTWSSFAARYATQMPEVDLPHVPGGLQA